MIRIKRLLAGLCGVVALLGATPQVANAAPVTSVQFNFTSGGLFGYDATKIYAGSGSVVRLTPDWALDGWDYAASTKLHLSVQRDTGAGWRTVANGQYPLLTMDVLTPKFKTSAKAQRVRYRLYSASYTAADGSGVRNASYSPTMTVVYENQAKYTGLAKQMYGYLRPYCPQAPVHVLKQIPGGGDAAGETTHGSQLVLVKADVSGLSSAYKRAIALHECGHVRQWLNYGASPAGDMSAAKAEAKYFTNDNPPRGVGWPYSRAVPKQNFYPVEHAADCGSIAISPKGYLGYGGYCNPSERKRAVALLHGKQYNLQPARKL